MGMDVYGKNPQSETGRYFRNNVWWWHPLADYIIDAHPEIAAACEGWHFNDGDGLNAELSKVLAKALTSDIESGKVAAKAKERDERIAALPRKTCLWCDGTGVRRDHIGYANRQYLRKIPEDERHPDFPDQPHPRAGQTGWCNGCKSRYPFSEENVREFAAYPLDEHDLRKCFLVANIDRVTAATARRKLGMDSYNWQMVDSWWEFLRSFYADVVWNDGLEFAPEGCKGTYPAHFGPNFCCDTCAIVMNRVIDKLKEEGWTFDGLDVVSGPEDNERLYASLARRDGT